jgi:hypothetical protein
MLLWGVEEGFPEGPDRPFHAALLVARSGITQADFDMVVAGELQEPGVILDLGVALDHHGSEVVVAEGMGNSGEGGEGQEMTLEKELEGGAGKDLGKEIARVAEEKSEAVEFSQLGMMDHEPIDLRFFPG